MNLTKGFLFSLGEKRHTNNWLATTPRCTQKAKQISLP